MNGGLTALVLAGTRTGGDPLASYAGVTHKALIEIGGRTMLERVVAALAAAPVVNRIVVAIEQPELVSALPAVGKPVSAIGAAAGPSASVAIGLQQCGAPLLVTTADHALLMPEWIAEFMASAPAADMVVALARRDAVTAAAPHTQRTYLHFADGDYSGCNLFLLRTTEAMNVIQFWQEIEAYRKRPLRMLRRLGWSYALRYRLGWLTLDRALQRLGALAGARVTFCTLRDGRAAIDVDKPADLELVRSMLR